MDGEESAVGLTGSLLVASPILFDPNFAESVLLVCQHDDNGALGLVLNRPTEAPAAEFLPGWADLMVEPAVVFLGGPVQQEMAIGLSRGAGPDDREGLDAVAGGLGLIDLSREPPEFPSVSEVRIFSGYAGWSGGQVEAEIEEGAWFVAGAHPEDVFTSDPLGLRRRVLRRQRGRMAMFADFPADPGLN